MCIMFFGMIFSLEITFVTYKVIKIFILIAVVY